MRIMGNTQLSLKYMMDECQPFMQLLHNRYIDRHFAIFSCDCFSKNFAYLINCLKPQIYNRWVCRKQPPSLCRFFFKDAPPRGEGGTPTPFLSKNFKKIESENPPKISMSPRHP